MFYFLLKLDPKNAFRRFHKDGIMANLSEFKIKTFYFTPNEFAAQFSKYFEIEKVFSLGLFTPPPYLKGIYNKTKSMVNALMKLDNLLKAKFPFNKAGDHFVIVLKRNNILVEE